MNKTKSNILLLLLCIPSIIYFVSFARKRKRTVYQNVFFSVLLRFTGVFRLDKGPGKLLQYITSVYSERINYKTDFIDFNPADFFFLEFIKFTTNFIRDGFSFRTNHARLSSTLRALSIIIIISVRKLSCLQFFMG